MAAKRIGRPRKIIDKKMFEALCGIQCTILEICGVLDVDDKTLTQFCHETYGKPFSEVFDEKRAGGRASLRRAQWQAAQAGNSALLIWLGKQHLDQREPTQNMAVQHSGQVDSKLAALSVEQLIRLAGEDDGNAEG